MLQTLTRAAAAGALCLTGLATGAAAQDIAQNPTYETVTLSAGFMPDPYTVPLAAGGDIDTRDSLGGDCRGSVASAPDVDLQYTAGSLPLYLSVTSDADTTLVVNTPDGQWYCNDDYTGLNPALTFGSPQSGLYNIWVGTYSSTAGFPDAQLHISELQVITENQDTGKTPPARVDHTLSPGYGSTSLNAGFLPDPHVANLVAGGEFDASDVSDGCWGYIAQAPDYNVNYSAGGFDLSFTAVSETDTVLVVRAPDGTYHCNDDGFGYPNPQVTVMNPGSGTYNVWVGTFSSEGGYPDAQLAVSELALGPNGEDQTQWDNGSTGGGVDWAMSPTAGAVSLSAGFLPDPHVAGVSAGGSVDASEVDGGCWGWVSPAPTYSVNYSAGSFDLTFTATSESDTVMMVRAPDGTFHCNDDGAGYPNPQVEFTNPQSGTYYIWVGRFGSSNQNDIQPAMLAVSELGLMPDGSGGDSDYEEESSIDWSLEPSYGEVQLDTGYLPDPHVVSLSAGGAQAASGASDSCRGYVASAPDYNLTYTAGDLYDLFISASGSADLTLVVNAPDGTWHCSDDYSGFNPGIQFVDPQSGLYNIWVGTYSSGAEYPPATLFISEEEMHF